MTPFQPGSFAHLDDDALRRTFHGPDPGLPQDHAFLPVATAPSVEEEQLRAVLGAALAAAADYAGHPHLAGAAELRDYLARALAWLGAERAARVRRPTGEEEAETEAGSLRAWLQGE